MPKQNPSPFQSGVDTLIYSAYYAPRGRPRLYMLAAKLSQRYLYPTDLLIGVIGSEGSGKSTLIQGLFPGLELTNDDHGLNVRPTPLYHFDPNDYFSGHTFHIDARYELAFHQKFKIAEAISRAISYGRRVIVEHFDLIYEALGHNAHILFGLGEEVVVARPSVFGPFPDGIKRVVDRTIRFRRMAHSAEDITRYILQRDFGYNAPLRHSDVKHGFVIQFTQPLDLDIPSLEQKVQDIIAKDVPIEPVGEEAISFGDAQIACTGVRTHISSSGQIDGFRLLKELKHDPLSGVYMLVGIVGHREIAGFEDISETMDR